MTRTTDRSPSYIRSGASELGVATDLTIAALPALIWCYISYGIRPIITVLLTALCAALFELILSLILRGGARVPTAAVLGMTAALFMPAGIGYIFAPIAALIAVLARRSLCGIVNPLAAALLPLFFLTEMTSHSELFKPLDVAVLGQVGERAESVLDILATGEKPDISELDLMLGNAPESIGSICGVLVILGGIYLIVRRVISWQTPVGYLFGAAVLWLILFFDTAHYSYIFYDLCAGGMLLAAFFGSTEYSSSPATPMARLIHGIGCGALAVLLRYFGIYGMSVLLALLIMSPFSRLLDMLTAARFFGYKEKKIFARIFSLFPSKHKKG